MLNAAHKFVDVLGVRFPLISSERAVSFLLARLGRSRSTAVCFPDMSTLNLSCGSPSFRKLLQRRVLPLNDGAGLALASQMLGRPFPENLNGTDLCPIFLAEAPEGTSVYLLGAQPGVAARAQAVLSARFPQLRFVGSHHGFLDAESEGVAVGELRRYKPQVVMVAMGNPMQIEFIDRHLDDPTLEGTLWLAVGGQLDYYGGTLTRAPMWMRRARLEWLHIVRSQPEKMRRYLIGIPKFLLTCALAALRGEHTQKGASRWQAELL
jgi:N-acetylglucosaminyldiphosphoundecaprenol N-acetyl-beta-D-mannosaminyltransferase